MGLNNATPGTPARALCSFKGRLLDAMATIGHTLDTLAARSGVTVAELEEAMATNGKSLSWPKMLSVAREVQARTRWLALNDGPRWPATLSDLDGETLAIARALPPEKLKFWLLLGQRLLAQ